MQYTHMLVELMLNIEACKYRCEAGPLENNTDWKKIKKIILNAYTDRAIMELNSVQSDEFA
jgi:hypothetical protein